MSGLATDIADTVALCMADIAQFIKDVRATHRMPPQRETPLEMAQRLQAAIQQYPPEPWISPKGVMFTASPFFLAMSLAQNGKQEIKRIERVFGERGY